MFRHPSYYKKLRASQVKKSDQVISEQQATASSMRAPGPGHKRQATSYKYPGPRPISNANKGLIHKRQASSAKQQAIEETVPHNDIEEAQASSTKLLEERATSIKRQA